MFAIRLNLKMMYKHHLLNTELPHAYMKEKSMCAHMEIRSLFDTFRLKY